VCAAIRDGYEHKTRRVNRKKLQSHFAIKSSNRDFFLKLRFRILTTHHKNAHVEVFSKQTPTSAN